MTFSKIKIAALASVALFAATAGANAAVVNWADWTVTNNGVSNTGATSAGIIYTGETQRTEFPYWTPASSWEGGPVSNAPKVLDNNNMIVLKGGQGTGTDTITFTTAVLDPVIAIWSLGQGQPGDLTHQAEFDFTTPFTIVAGGPNDPYGGGPLTANILNTEAFGNEGNGVVRFNGLVKSISFTTPEFEDYYGFTVGTGAVPEPATWAMLLIGFGAIGWTLRSARKGVAVTA